MVRKKVSAARLVEGSGEEKRWSWYWEAETEKPEEKE